MAEDVGDREAKSEAVPDNTTKESQYLIEVLDENGLAVSGMLNGEDVQRVVRQSQLRLVVGHVIYLQRC
jgi:hypothetical protein